MWSTPTYGFQLPNKLQEMLKYGSESNWICTWPIPPPHATISLEIMPCLFCGPIHARWKSLECGMKTESIFQASYVSPPTYHTLKGGVVLQYFPQWISCFKWSPVHETIMTQSILLTAVHKCYWGQMVDVRTFFSTASSDLSGGRASAKSVVFRVTGFLLLPPLPPLPTLPSPPCSCGAVSERLWCFFIKFFLPGFQMSTGEKVTSS